MALLSDVSNNMLHGQGDKGNFGPGITIEAFLLQTA